MSASPPRTPLPRLRRPAEAALFDVLASGGSSGYAHVVVRLPSPPKGHDWTDAWARLVAHEPIIASAIEWRGLPRPCWVRVAPRPPVVLQCRDPNGLATLEAWFETTRPELEQDPLVVGAILVDGLAISLGLSYCPAACNERIAARILSRWIGCAHDPARAVASEPWPREDDNLNTPPETTAFWKARLAECGSPLPLAVDRRTADVPRRSRASVVRVPLPSRWESSQIDRTLAALGRVASDFGGGHRPTVGLRSSTGPLDAPISGQSVLPICVPSDPEFENMVQAVVRARLGALEHADISSRTLHRWAELHRDVDLMPVVLTCWSEDPMRPLTVGQTVASARWSLVARDPIEIAVYPGAAHLEVRFHPRRFESAEAESFATAVAQRLGGMPGHTARPQMLQLPCDAAQAVGPSVLQQFLKRARASPDARALVAPRQTLTYSELESAARDVARRLGTAGVATGDFVAVLRDTDVDVIVALLGIAWAGAVAVPLDAADDSAGVPTWLADGNKGWAWASPARIASLPPGVRGIDAAAPTDSSDEVPPPSNEAGLAYAIQTSGSTGPAKAVLCSHQALCSSVAARSSVYAGVAPERMLLTLSTAFDGGLGCMWWTLVSGAELHLLPPASKSDAAMWPGFIEERNITHLMTLPPLYESCLRGAVGDQLQALRAVSVGGEVCPPELVALHFATTHGARLVNEYGPSEAVVWATAHRCESTDRVAPIGRLRDGILGAISFERGSSTGPGAVGELVLTGEALANGYLGSAAQTRANAFTRAPDGVASFRTGDLVAARADGTLVFVGRMDGQHKHAGRRIDLEALGKRIAALPNVEDAHVMLVAGDPVRLVAYVTADDEFDGATAARALRASVALGVVPNVWMAVERIPRLEDGAALPGQLPPPPRPRAAVGPRTFRHPLARQLATLWTETIGAQPMDPTQNFFDAGGHSLLASRLVARLREPPFGVAVSLSSFFAAPSIEGLLRLVQEARRGGDIVTTRRDSQEIRAAIDSLPPAEVDRLLHELGGLRLPDRVPTTEGPDDD